MTCNINKSDNRGGSHFIGSLDTTYDKIVRVFGEPHCGESGDGKVQVEWCFEFEDTGETFTIYDYKSYVLNFKDNTDWHIGGMDHKVADRVKQYFFDEIGKDV